GITVSTLFATQNVCLILSFEHLYSSIFPGQFERSSNKVLAMVLAISTYDEAFEWVPITKRIRVCCTPSKPAHGTKCRRIQGRACWKYYYRIDEQSLISTVSLMNLFTLVIISIDFYLNFLRKKFTLQFALHIISDYTNANISLHDSLPNCILEGSEQGELKNDSEFASFQLLSRPPPVGHQIFFELKKARTKMNLMFKSFHSKCPIIYSKAFTTFILPNIEYCSVIWNPTSSVKLTKELEGVQRDFTRRLYSRCVLPPVSYSERLRDLKFTTLEQRRFVTDIVFLHSIIHKRYLLDVSSLLITAPLNRTLRNDHPLRISLPFLPHNSQSTLASRAISTWNSLESSSVALPHDPFRKFISSSLSTLFPT
ncbi:hypothetical protein PRIPAC_80535, partial [Pristionchus pacificus]|uniref:Uncharacterized protein n=1 Tax=Pristionchus pacificus TaxID=54126 RepID=A0A2A6CLA4_PRIPA